MIRSTVSETGKHRVLRILCLWSARNEELSRVQSRWMKRRKCAKHAIICVFCGARMVISAVSGLGPGKLQPKCALDCGQSSILTSCTEKRKELPLWWFSIYSGQHGIGKWNALWRHKVCWVPFIYFGMPWHGTQSIGKNRAAKPTQTEGFAVWHCEMQY